MKKYINRTLEKTLKRVIDKTSVIMITGPRQVGKSTLLNYLESTYSKKINKVSLDNMLLRVQAREDPELFLRGYETPLIIDEFQYAPELLTYIKIKVDEEREAEMFHGKAEVGTMYYLTGSQVFETIKDVSESLVGRVAILDLYGLSRREIHKKDEQIFIPDYNLLKNKEKLETETTSAIYKHILNGSYPEIINEFNLDRELFYETYVRTYIERDIRSLMNIKDENKFIKFLSSLAARTSQEYNATDIASDIEVDAKTVDEWISILKNTHLIYMLQSYSNNNVKKAIKRPKIYFMDTGLACYLTGYMSSETLEKSPYNGAIFENYIVVEIIKTFTNNGMDAKKRLFYYRDTAKREIDLLVFYDNKVYPVEIKKSTSPSSSATKNFNVVENFGVQVGNGVVLCMVKDIIPLKDNNYLVPIEYI